MYADLCVRTADLEKSLDLGRELRLDMIGFIIPPGDIPSVRSYHEKRGWKRKPFLALGTEIVTKRISELRRDASRLRSSSDILAARGGSEEMNRAILETPEIDIITGHETGGRCGINHVLARLAKRNNISVCFDLNRLIASYRLGRIQEFSSMTETARIVKRFGAPFVITSGAMDAWGLRSPSELVALGMQLGFTESESRRGLSPEIVRENRKRLSGRWVMPGIEIEP